MPEDARNTAAMTDPDATGLVEAHSIEFVPLGERHGRVVDLFTLWFGTNIAPLPVVTGAMAVQVYGLNVVWGIIAIALGHALGGVVLALSSAQGPQVGVPQMMQSRGQFGRYGALLVVGFAAIIYVGFFTSNVILASQSIHALAPAVGLSSGAIIAGLAAAGIGIVGYNFIHLLNRIGTVVMGITLVAGYVLIINRLPADFASRGTVTFGGVLATLSLAAIWQISYACYTSDYSRYLPPSVGTFRPFMATYLGALLGTTLSFVFGALAVLAAPARTAPLEAVRETTGSLGAVLMFLFILNVISHNALNIYGATLAIITSIQTFASRWVPTKRVRVAVSVLVLVACVTAAVGAADDFIARFMRFILTMLIVLVPWATINILDFYVVKRRQYDTQSLFAADGGCYGLIRPTAMIAYVAGILVQFPFMAVPSYTGPVAAALGGADISWFVSPLASGWVYLWLEARAARQRALLHPSA
jgi:purine-cytosine permease-like protein